GAECVAILGATAAAYSLTPDDIGSTLSAVVTATGRGGSTSSPAPTTLAVVAAPVPPAVVGSLVAAAGAAGAVTSLDGTATVTWQPGAVPAGSTVTLAKSGKGLLLGVSPAPAQLPWPVDLVYATSTADVVGTSVDGKLWSAAPRLRQSTLPVAALTGTYVDPSGLTHVLLRTPARVALFTPGAWGDPSLVAAGPPTPRLAGRLQVRRLRDGSVLVTARVRVPSQAHLWISVQGPTRQSLLRTPGVVPVRVHLSGRRLPRGAKATLRVAARDPWGRAGVLLTPFRAP
ncbi:MAG: hypothetical protein QOF43_279, partial [Gaiellaceae bacterium]|nr:hypothetical protein [Gaiellaceae bacterium]